MKLSTSNHYHNFIDIHIVFYIHVAIVLIREHAHVSFPGVWKE